MLAVLIGAPQMAAAADFGHAVGATYLSGYGDVIDFYEREIHGDASSVPVGLSYRLIAAYDSGMRLDVGLGPLAFIFGDVSYSAIPLSVTIGYDTNPNSGTNFYVRGGASVVFLSADNTDDSSAVGGVAALGIEFGGGNAVQFFMELAYDSSEFTFNGRNGEEKMSPQEIMFTVGARF